MPSTTATPSAMTAGRRGCQLPQQSDSSERQCHGRRPPVPPPAACDATARASAAVPRRPPPRVENPDSAAGEGRQCEGRQCESRRCVASAASAPATRDPSRIHGGQPANDLRPHRRRRSAPAPSFFLSRPLPRVLSSGNVSDDAPGSPAGGGEAPLLASTRSGDAAGCGLPRAAATHRRQRAWLSTATGPPKTRRGHRRAVRPRDAICCPSQRRRQ